MPEDGEGPPSACIVTYRRPTFVTSGGPSTVLRDDGFASVAPAAQDDNYSKYLRRKFAELKFCAIMPAKIQSAGRLRSTI